MNFEFAAHSDFNTYTHNVSKCSAQTNIRTFYGGMRIRCSGQLFNQTETRTHVNEPFFFSHLLQRYINKRTLTYKTKLRRIIVVFSIFVYCVYHSKWYTSSLHTCIVYISLTAIQCVSLIFYTSTDKRRVEERNSKAKKKYR